MEVSFSAALLGERSSDLGACVVAQRPDTRGSQPCLLVTCVAPIAMLNLREHLDEAGRLPAA